ncbi:hypothetical protein [Haloferax prahovense]|uniref:hypothetical protein n=1 Tax=Haloferax prahovense TaxID=381852 RepID=UPI00067983D4|nr:hypothetical protein [Haloferax prahovense]
MVFRKLRNHDGTPLVALDPDELAIDGILDENKEVPENQQMYVQRMGKGVYIVREVPNEGTLPPLTETPFVQALASQEALKRTQEESESDLKSGGTVVSR